MSDTLRIIVLEDEASWSKRIDDALAREGWFCDIHADPASFLAALGKAPWDIAILDILIGEFASSGIDVLAEIRAKGLAIPTMMLTQIASHERAACALDVGADDYLTKPFQPAELVARIKAMRRRATPLPGVSLKHGPLTVNLHYRSAHWYESRLELRGQGFDILLELAKAAGEPVSHEVLWRSVWTKWDRLPPQEQPIQAGISRLRKDLATVTSAEVICTIAGVGYCLAPL